MRDQCDQALRGAGFDGGRDIRAITVNRWPHGYDDSPDLIWEPEYRSEDEKAWVIGRRRLDRIAIASSGADASADTSSAITHAARAVSELADG